MLFINWSVFPSHAWGLVWHSLSSKWEWSAWQNCTEMSKYLSSIHPSSSFKLNLTENKARYPGILPAHIRVLVNVASLSWPLHISSEKRKMIAHCFDCFLLKRQSVPFTFLIQEMTYLSRFAVPAERQWSWSSDKICSICRSVKKKKEFTKQVGI